MVSTTPARVPNEELADALERVADLLQAQDGQPFRVRAYRAAAATLRGLPEPAVAILEREGAAGLLKLPGIGKSIAALIEEYAHNGRLGLLDRLEGQIAPEDLFTTVPGIGEELAARIHRELHVETLEELEVAAHDGRLATVPGLGPRRVRAIRDSLAAMLAKSARRRARHRQQREHEPLERPSVSLLLAVDDEYRRRADAGELRTIAPRRFNPRHESWLPVLHTERDGWSFTALYSNTARAHELGRTRDWVIVFWERDGHEDQCTVVTEWQGALTGQRVVRGREREARAEPGASGTAAA